MRLTKTLLLVISAIVITASSATRAQTIKAVRPCASPFLAVAASGRFHFAFSASSCSDAAMDACNAQAAELKRNCEYRGEDGGSTYSSCRCQSIRAAKDCYADAGCSIGSALFTEISPECFGIQ